MVEVYVKVLLDEIDVQIWKMEELKILIDQLLVEKDLVMNVWKEILLGLDLPLLK